MKAAKNTPTNEFTAKCIHCGKTAGNHLAKTKACPVGTRHSVVGYSTYSKTEVFTPRKPKR